MQVIREREDEAGVRLWCKHCNRIWLYRGHSNFYACCSQCHTAVHVRHKQVGNNVALSKAKQQINNGDVKMKKLLQSDSEHHLLNQTVTTTEPNGSESNG